MRCGALATLQRTKTFAWHPPWVTALFLAGVVPWAILAILLTRRMTVHGPLCPAHENHWGWRTGILWFGYLIFAVLGTAPLVIGIMGQGTRSAVAAHDLCLGTLIFGVFWFYTVTFVKYLG